MLLEEKTPSIKGCVHIQLYDGWVTKPQNEREVLIKKTPTMDLEWIPVRGSWLVGWLVGLHKPAWEKVQIDTEWHDSART